MLRSGKPTGSWEAPRKPHLDRKAGSEFTPAVQVAPVEGAVGWLESLIASSDAESIRALTNTLTRCEVDPVVCSKVTEARTILDRLPIGLVICQDRLPDGTFEDMLREVARMTTPVPVVAVSSSADWDRYLHAMRLGASDYLAFPYHEWELERIVRRGSTFHLPSTQG